MTRSTNEEHPIRQLARYQIRPEARERVLAAIHEFLAYLRANEPGTLRYEVWQEHNDPTRFVHIFTFRDAGADKIHSEIGGGQEILRDPLPGVPGAGGVHRLQQGGLEYGSTLLSSPSKYFHLPDTL